MPATPPNFLENPFEGKDPFGVITIHLGVLQSLLSCLIVYPGLKPFLIEPMVPIPYEVDGLQVASLPLHLFPPHGSPQPGNFEKSDLPPNTTVETILTAFFSGIRTKFDKILQGAEIWDAVKNHSRVVFIHPDIWDDHLPLIKRCLENAGWLVEKRELVFCSEERATITNFCHPNKFPKTERPPKNIVVINDCGRLAMSVSCFQVDREKPWEGKHVWTRQACDAGFGVAFNTAVGRGIQPKTERNIQYDPGRLIWVLDVDEGTPTNSPYPSFREGDIVLTVDEVNTICSKSVATLAELLSTTFTTVSTDSWVLCCGKYSRSDKIQELVLKQLHNLGNDLKTLDSRPYDPLGNIRGDYKITDDAITFYLRSTRWVQPHQSCTPDRGIHGKHGWTESKIYKAGTGFYCYQFNPDGSEPNIYIPVPAPLPPTVSEEPALQVDALKPPSPEINSHVRNIRETACLCYGQILPWESAETENSLLVPVVDRMLGCFKSYALFLQDSFEASKSGYSVSNECEILCKKIIGGILAEELQKTIQDLLAMAKAALESATKMKESFSSVRQNVIRAQEVTSKTVDGLRRLGVSVDKVHFLDPNSRPPPVDRTESSSQLSGVPVERRGSRLVSDLD